MWVFGGYIAAVFLIGALSHRIAAALSRRGSHGEGGAGTGGFLNTYFLGDRGLGGWTLAFTFAATAISGGTFMGIPSLIYQKGWSMALWLAGFMITPLVSMALIGKRLNRVGRALGSITVPDVLRDRFGSPALGLLATAAIVFFLLFNLVAQFKGGGLIMRAALAPALDSWGWSAADGYRLGVGVFAVTVIAYTTYGGFWAVTLTDVLEGAVMLAGAVVLVPMVLSQAGGTEAATQRLAEIDPDLVTLPGPGNFLPVSLALSFFLFWPLVSLGQPSGMVRLMSFKDTASLRKALFVVSIYFALTYVSLLLVFTCARAMLPTEYLGRSDEIMPAMITRTAPPWLAGVLLAAPYAAIMSTVAAFLLMIGSGLVRDVWQRSVDPGLSDGAARIASYAVTAGAGLLAAVLALWPPEFLQYVILFTGSGLASCFLAPMVLALYWRRATRAGALAAFAAGFATHATLYGLGWAGLRSEVQAHGTGFQPYYLLGMDPEIWGLTLSFAAGMAVSFMTVPPPRDVTGRLFGEAEPSAS
jgi:SSS family transporter